jgi:hypothetical protein
VTTQPLPDPRDEAVARRAADLALSRLDARRHRRQVALRADLVARVEAFLADHPDASAGAVVAAVGARRQDVLDTIRAVRESGNRFPSRRSGTFEAGCE